MLCLTAKEGGYLMIGDDIKVFIMKKKSSGQVHIGISAPKSVSIKRDKVFEQELKAYANDGSKTPAEIFKALEILHANQDESALFRRDIYKNKAKHAYDETKRLERETERQENEKQAMEE